MKIILTGGGTGGHFYPLIAVARSLKDIAERERIVNLNMVYAAPDPYDPDTLNEENIKFLSLPAGKIRNYYSIWNFLDPIKTFFGVLKALFKIYMNFPDVIFAKGGYASFPAMMAAKLLKIPLVIHESDAVPGKATLWASKFAKRIAVSFPQTAADFPEKKVALTGNPIRRQILGGNAEMAKETFKLEPGVPVILILGGSQGSRAVNDIILDILSELVDSFQVIHVAGKNNVQDIKMRSEYVLSKSPHAKRHHLYGFLREGDLRNASRVASLVIARAGGGTIFEIAAWGIPSILIPLPSAAQDHQRENAYLYAREGGAVVMEEKNLKPHLLLSEVNKIFSDEKRRTQMSKAAGIFAKLDGADVIAEEIIHIALGHA